MNTSLGLVRTATLFAVTLLAGKLALAQTDIPAPLEPWKDWVTWQDKDRDCPTPYHADDQHICFWPSKLALTAGPQGATWELEVDVFGPTWIQLPGSAAAWPINVRANEEPLAVVERDGGPAIHLDAGHYELTGEFQWTEMPQQLRIPKQIGLLSLVLNDTQVEIPNWDPEGRLWLKRIRAESTDKDDLSAQVYRVIEDGIPMWLQTEIELSVGGKSREEQLGCVMPEGWKISMVESPIPVAVDDQGQMKAQVRAGKWVLRLSAFRVSDFREFRFAPEVTPIIDVEWVAFQAKPEFRMAELEEISAVDVTQITFPERWRNLPVYEWKTDTPFRLTEKMRGMGLQQPDGLNIQRQFWIDEDGAGLTFRDQIGGQMQQEWRLDVAEGQELGAVRMEGTGQLITANPETGAEGVEIRTRNLRLDAIGRIGNVREIAATGWQTDVDSLGVTINLPPGWRLFALFGADWVEGDWLTAWTLLDLFLLLIFSLAVFRLWGAPAGVVAFIAFGLAYHEPGAPRFTWLFLLIPLAVLRVVPEGTARRWVTVWKYLAVALLVSFLVPFVAGQIQSAIYPQLEKRGMPYRARGIFRQATGRRPASQRLGVLDSTDSSAGLLGRQKIAEFAAPNLLYESKARIQTGPAEPEWSWNRVECGWNGPVVAGETIHPLLISLRTHRVLTLVRLAFLLVLAAILLRIRGGHNPLTRRTASAAVLMLTLLTPSLASAQLPDQQLLDDLRARLLEPSDAYPHAAEIPSVSLNVDDRRIVMEAEVHAAVRVAVPLPGQLPSWSPVSVKVDDEADVVVCRREGYLWVVVPEGVHRVLVEGLLPNATEWEWTYLLAPRRVSIEAPGWNVTGVRPNGIPEKQVFFAQQREVTEGEAAYDRKDFNAIVTVDRHLEMGLRWQLRSEVTRLSAPGKAVSMKVPLLDGEKVLSSNAVVENGFVEVRLGAGQKTFSWQSELPIAGKIDLAAEDTERWVERWHLVTSPVWNVSYESSSSLTPIFEPQQQNLVPVWHPWPGESVSLTFSKPEAVSGDTITVRRVEHKTTLGSRQRNMYLKLDVECSLGDDFVIGLDPNADKFKLKQDGRSIPVRRDGASLIVPVHPGKQVLEVEWLLNSKMETVVSVGNVTLPMESANISTALEVPESRWVLWTHGPLRGPAVRFWSILACAILAALVLGSLPLSPLRRWEWILLGLGLTQVHLAAALTVVAWLFLLAWRGRPGHSNLSAWRFDCLQIGLVFLTAAALTILVVVVGEGLLGSPEMFISGNGSSRDVLNWFQPGGGRELPAPWIVSISVWYYRLLMLAWALWLASALIRWLGWGWSQFSHEGGWKRLWKQRQPAPMDAIIEP